MSHKFLVTLVSKPIRDHSVVQLSKLASEIALSFGTVANVNSLKSPNPYLNPFFCLTLISFLSLSETNQADSFQAESPLLSLLTMTSMTFILTFEFNLPYFF